ncbi:unnamed protein product [Prorocentrum cordatum]|uniref:Microbial-type PARG catalytic domain-containing protein n=1 Tax=Prorocentrum cordatum TaxID=2364126 RepID=A0ABN9T5E1_9DINO|nr:unnamed protein product [Polarella glacialis]
MGSQASRPDCQSPRDGHGSPPLLCPEGWTADRVLVSDRVPDSGDSVGLAAGIAQARARRDYSALKSLLRQVAESNYKLRRRWQTARTVPVSHAQCMEFAGKGHNSPNLSFSTMSTADALLHFGRQRGAVVCGLNFANGETAGGGYKKGATAQEEDLCRRVPTLYSALFQAEKAGLYPFGPSTCWFGCRPEKYADVLYTSDLVVAREGEEGGFALLPEHRQARVSLVSAAAPNVKFKSEVSNPALIYRAIQSIFIAPVMIEPHVNTLVLGAWGCGAFGGDPAQISDMFTQALVHDNLGHPYREVHFAIPPGKNCDVFLEHFRRHKLKVRILK